MHLEASTLLNIREQDFINCLDWNNCLFLFIDNLTCHNVNRPHHSYSRKQNCRSVIIKYNSETSKYVSDVESKLFNLKQSLVSSFSQRVILGNSSNYDNEVIKKWNHIYSSYFINTHLVDKYSIQLNNVIANIFMQASCPNRNRTSYEKNKSPQTLSTKRFIFVDKPDVLSRKLIKNTNLENCAKWQILPFFTNHVTSPSHYTLYVNITGITEQDNFSIKSVRFVQIVENVKYVSTNIYVFQENLIYQLNRVYTVIDNQFVLEIVENSHALIINMVYTPINSREPILSLDNQVEIGFCHNVSSRNDYITKRDINVMETLPENRTESEYKKANVIKKSSFHTLNERYTKLSEPPTELYHEEAYPRDIVTFAINSPNNLTHSNYEYYTHSTYPIVFDYTVSTPNLLNSFSNPIDSSRNNYTNIRDYDYFIFSLTNPKNSILPENEQYLI
ncbi:hypothetical protein A3Q56_05748 [Intoshia linei]|uniref:Uncharacterized protein n=1 Tax=Intoshia linei TaxID=1819745 RepID=A0A177AZA1_9BILA|nr:hypothetical protein A3Q56_05748 [Intoshia linei]